MKTKKLWTTAIAAFMIAAFIGGCKDENVETVGLCPLVISTNPANLATSVPLNQVITVTFNEAMNPLTITPGAFALSSPSGARVGSSSKNESEIPGTLSYDAASHSMTFKPNVPLKSNATYTGTVATSVKDVAGNALQVAYNWTFSTGLVVSPAVISVDPLNAATGVSLNKTVSANFSTAMDPLTLTGATFTVASGTTAIPGSVSYAGTTASFISSSPLSANTLYTATITTGAKNVAGTPLANNYTWSFTTGTTPTVLSTDPLNLASGVALNKVIGATFSEAMNPLTLTTSTFTLMNGATPVAGAVSYAGTTATFTPTVSLLAGITYTATITTGATSVGGIALSSVYVWTFTTANVPTVLSTDPLDLATGVALNKVISATFSQSMDALTITGSTFTLMIGATPVGGSVNYSGSTATFTPTSNLLSGSTYTATITTGAKNPGGTPLASDYVWTFNTNAPLGPLAVNLGTVARFGIIAGVGVSNNAGPSQINNLDVGIYPGAFFAADDVAPPGTNAMLNQAQLDLVAAYNQAAGATTPAPNVAPADLGGQTLAPGIWTSASTMLLQNGDLTLDAQGDANAVWIFQIGSAFTSVGTGPFPSPSGGNVILAGGAQAKNVFWQVGSSAIIGDFTSFKGNVLAFSSITMNSGAVAEGRMLARNGAVVMTSTNIINKP
jgi:hypothetical protein